MAVCAAEISEVLDISFWQREGIPPVFAVRAICNTTSSRVRGLRKFTCKRRVHTRSVRISPDFKHGKRIERINIADVSLSTCAKEALESFSFAEA